MERRAAALVLVAAGVWVQWGPGFGLIVAGVLLGASGLELDKVAVSCAGGVRRAYARTRAVVVAMPRRATAAGLIAVAGVCLPVGALLAAGAWAGFVAVGGMSAAVGAVLGWE